MSARTPDPKCETCKGSGKMKIRALGDANWTEQSCYHCTVPFTIQLDWTEKELIEKVKKHNEDEVALALTNAYSAFRRKPGPDEFGVLLNAMMFWQRKKLGRDK